MQKNTGSQKEYDVGQCEVKNQRYGFLSTCSVMAVGLLVGMGLTMTVPLLGFAQAGSIQANEFRAKFRVCSFERMLEHANRSKSDVIPKDTTAVVSKDGAVTAVEDQKLVPGKTAELPKTADGSGYVPGQSAIKVVEVMHGDTLSEISRKVGCSVDALAHHNEIDDVNLIYDGSSLRVPNPPEEK